MYRLEKRTAYLIRHPNFRPTAFPLKVCAQRAGMESGSAGHVQLSL
jgi:hypothetical protein